jgi:hypothetical protein
MEGWIGVCKSCKSYSKPEYVRLHESTQGKADLLDEGEGLSISVASIEGRRCCAEACTPLHCITALQHLCSGNGELSPTGDTDSRERGLIKSQP